ncbi:hypothetical protein WJX74_000824 [Apatococcus lobatus]|uniref:Uncharacterized protein n=1 Tax=Apatococcus lobatus TaxID=904363 RepID=A0AAW1RRY3_9CHLO
MPHAASRQSGTTQPSFRRQHPKDRSKVVRVKAREPCRNALCAESLDFRHQVEKVGFDTADNSLDLAAALHRVQTKYSKDPDHFKTWHARSTAFLKLLPAAVTDAGSRLLQVTIKQLSFKKLTYFCKAGLCNIQGDCRNPDYGTRDKLLLQTAYEISTRHRAHSTSPCHRENAMSDTFLPDFSPAKRQRSLPSSTNRLVKDGRVPAKQGRHASPQVLPSRSRYFSPEVNHMPLHDSPVEPQPFTDQCLASDGTWSSPSLATVPSPDHQPDAADSDMHQPSSVQMTELPQLNHTLLAGLASQQQDLKDQSCKLNANNLAGYLQVGSEQDAAISGCFMNRPEPCANHNSCELLQQHTNMQIEPEAAHNQHEEIAFRSAGIDLESANGDPGNQSGTAAAAKSNQVKTQSLAEQVVSSFKLVSEAAAATAAAKRLPSDRPPAGAQGPARQQEKLAQQSKQRPRCPGALTPIKDAATTQSIIGPTSAQDCRPCRQQHGGGSEAYIDEHPALRAVHSMLVEAQQLLRPSAIMAASLIAVDHPQGIHHPSPERVQALPPIGKSGQTEVAKPRCTIIQLTPRQATAQIPSNRPSAPSAGHTTTPGQALSSEQPPVSGQTAGPSSEDPGAMKFQQDGESEPAPVLPKVTSSSGHQRPARAETSGVMLEWMQKTEAKMEQQGTVLQAILSHWLPAILQAACKSNAQHPPATHTSCSKGTDDGSHAAEALISNNAQAAMAEVLVDKLWPLEALLEQAVASHGEMGQVLHELQALRELPQAVVLIMDAIGQLHTKFQDLQGPDLTGRPISAHREGDRAARSQSKNAAPAHMQGMTKAGGQVAAHRQDDSTNDHGCLRGSICPSSASLDAIVSIGCKDALADNNIEGLPATSEHMHQQKDAFAAAALTDAPSSPPRQPAAGAPAISGDLSS